MLVSEKRLFLSYLSLLSIVISIVVPVHLAAYLYHSHTYLIRSEHNWQLNKLIYCDWCITTYNIFQHSAKNSLDCIICTSTQTILLFNFICIYSPTKNYNKCSTISYVHDDLTKDALVRRLLTDISCSCGTITTIVVTLKSLIPKPFSVVCLVLRAELTFMTLLHHSLRISLPPTPISQVNGTNHSFSQSCRL